ncbi:hypothetical protein EVB91_219 [Rhizobium phage RHph_I1_18]|nr:hypothetical protein EVB91_219 [Rhizobium phage RHph_I1_18]
MLLISIERNNENRKVRMTKQKMTNKILKQVDELQRSGMLVKDIATIVGLDDTTIYYHTNKRFAERRRQQWRDYRKRVRAKQREESAA